MRKFIFLLVLAITTIGCADNATMLAYKIKKAASELRNSADGSTSEIDYVPKTGSNTPYLILLLPQRKLTLGEVITTGVPERQATEIFSKLAYVNVDHGGTLVVMQAGQRLNFTYYWRRFAQVDDIIHWSGTGPVTLRLKKSGGHIKVTGFE